MNEVTVPGHITLTAEEIAAAEKRFLAIRGVLLQRGIADIPEDSEEGRLVNHIIGEIQRAGSPRLPDYVKAIYAEAIVGGLLLQRAAVSYLMVAAPLFYNDADTPGLRIQRANWDRAINTYAKASAIITQNLKALGAEAEKETDKAYHEILDELRKPVKTLT